MECEIWTPINMNILQLVDCLRRWIRRCQHEFLFFQQVNDEPWSVLRCVHDCYIDKAGSDMSDKILRDVHVDAKSNVAK